MFTGAAALSVYAWGLLLVAGAVMVSNGGAGSAPAPPRRTPGHEERALHVVDQSVTFLPPASVCETAGGGGYPATTSPATSHRPPPSSR